MSHQLTVQETISFLRNEGLTYCGRPGKLETLSRLVHEIEAKQIPGLIVEAGVAMGGSASIIAKSKDQSRQLWLFDVFELLPAPSRDDDRKSHEAYNQFKQKQAHGLTDQNYVSHLDELLTYAQLTMEKVGVDFRNSNIRFIKGDFEHTMNINEPIAFAHIDCDWYQSVKTCISRLSSSISPGGIVLFDDYNSFAGCKRAVDEWLGSTNSFRVIHSDWTLAARREE